MTKAVPDDIVTAQNKGKSNDGQFKPENENSKDRSRHDDTSEAEQAWLAHSKITQAWAKGNSAAEYLKKYSYLLWKKDTEDKNIIHRAIVQLPKGKHPPEEALNHIEAMVLRDPTLFTATDLSDKVPMFEAAKLHVTILFRVIDLLIPKTVLEKIKTRCDTATKSCPVWSVPVGRLEQCPKKSKTAKDSLAENEDRKDSIAAKMAELGAGSSRKYCIHELVDIDLVLERDQLLRDTLQEALRQNQNGQAQFLQPLLTEVRFDPRQERNGQLISLESFKTLLQLCDNAVFTEPLLNRYSLLQMAVLLYDCQSLDYDLLYNVIEALIKRSPESIFFTGDGNAANTAYRMLKDQQESDQNSVSLARATELLKSTCIGNQSKDDGEKKSFLYWDAKSEKKFSLNLAAESVILDREYIETIVDQSGITFESVLDFVKLPCWKPVNWTPHPIPQKPSTESDPTAQEEDTTDIIEPYPDPYKPLFEWLWVSGVRKIFTVEVEDDGLEPHTNASIRESFSTPETDTEPARNIEVEVWKWKKYDICSETVAFAAPEARKIHLYSHGNTAVLRGWACSPGFAALQRLEELTIHIHPTNLNDDRDCAAYKAELQKKLSSLCPFLDEKKTHVKNYGYRADKSDKSKDGANTDSNDLDEHTNSKDMPKSNVWANQLYKFRGFLHALDRSKDLLPNSISIKVAILDDGAQLSGLEGTQHGLSFGTEDEYFVTPCDHGTQMAYRIRDICPMAELYIARLDTSKKVENQKFTIASCYDALKWALEMEVDIISMSWTFKKKGGSKDEYEKKFVDLLETAANSKKVILFGALPDEGPETRTSDFAPVGVDSVIKIGSATKYGEPSKENVLAKLDFLFPGEDIPIPGSKELVRGSSYATAYASGLAAMALFCVKAHIALNDLTEDERMIRALENAKSVDGMKSIFARLTRTGPEDDIKGTAFVRPYFTFKPPFQDSTDGKKKDLERIVSAILPTKDF